GTLAPEPPPAALVLVSASPPWGAPAGWALAALEPVALELAGDEPPPVAPELLLEGPVPGLPDGWLAAPESAPEPDAGDDAGAAGAAGVTAPPAWVSSARSQAASARPNATTAISVAARGCAGLVVCRLFIS